MWRPQTAPRRSSAIGQTESEHLRAPRPSIACFSPSGVSDWDSLVSASTAANIFLLRCSASLSQSDDLFLVPFRLANVPGDLVRSDDLALGIFDGRNR